MKIPFLDLLKFKEAENQLKYVTPYSFIMTPGVCFLKNGAKYEENVKRAKTMDMIGLIFIVMCLGMIMAEAVALFMA